MRRFAVVLAATALLSDRSAAQQRILTLNDIYGTGKSAAYNGSPVTTVSWIDNPWLDDSHYLWPAGDRQASPMLKVDARSGSSAPLYSEDALSAALRALPGVDADAARTAARAMPLAFTSNHDGFLLTLAGDLFYFDIARSKATRLTTSQEKAEEAAISPDGRMAAYVSGNNLFVTAIDKPAPRALTNDGTPELLNGRLDWVYSEELYGRGTYRAYWWSPDSASIAYLQLDDRPVPTYPLSNPMEYHPTVELERYPKAGDPNPIARLAIANVSGGRSGKTVWVDTSRYGEHLVVDVAWSPDSRSVVYQVQNRTQTWLDLNAAERDGGRTRTLFRETSPAWVKRWQGPSASPVWLHDGSFLWLSERSGWRHVYHYRPDGTLIKQLTSGSWEARGIRGVDETGRWVYFSATERSVLGSDIYRVNFDGSGFQRVSAAPGIHRAFFNPGGTLFLDSWSDATTPPQVRLHDANGNELRAVAPNPVHPADDFHLVTPEFVQVKARDGFVFEAELIKPPDFDPSRRYPVYQYLYGGPHSQTVLNAWGRSQYMYEQLLAQHGIIVWLCDNRTASGKGATSEYGLYKNLGESELNDIEDCLSWLKAQPFVDSSRIGLEGYSYGGYLAAYALTHPSSFSVGIAGGPVTDWRDYDTIYTERYMGLPRENVDGYRKSSPRFSAAGFHGDLLLLHDVNDDNVHVQNTLQFAYELQKAGKLFQMMLYPTAGHGIAEPELNLHSRELMLQFTLDRLHVP